MKIIKLQSENFKKIKAIEIIPGEKNTVVISGKNGQGKSSILDSIFVALGGKPSDLTKPIREGEERATIQIELTNYFVTRTFKQGSSKLEVVSKPDGEIMTSPQMLLDKIIGTLAFDPLEFQNMKDKEQRATLLKLTNLDLDSYAKSYQALYDLRHDSGVAMGQYAELTMPEIAQAETIIQNGKVDVNDVLSRIHQAQEDMRQYSIAVEQKSVKEKQLQSIKDQIQTLQLSAENLEKEIQAIQITPCNSDHVEIEALKVKLVSAESQNSQYTKAEMMLKQHEDRLAIKARWDELSEQMKSINVERDYKLKEAKMPIEGLSVTDSNVVYNGIPFAQLSSAEKLKISMSIAMAMKPELRVIRIMDGSLLDEDNLKVIQEMAGEKDFQVWIEKVDSSGKVGFYIEEGEVKAINE